MLDYFDPTGAADHVADGPTDLLPDEDIAGTDRGDASGLVRARIDALIAAARDLSDTCADLADALRPVPGSDMDDPLTMDFGRLRAERTAALLDEAASAARGTFGLLGAAQSALENETRPVAGAEPEQLLPLPRAAASTWPDAFQEVPPRSVPDDAEEDLAVAAGLDQYGGRELGGDFDHPEPATLPAGLPAVLPDPLPDGLPDGLPGALPAGLSAGPWSVSGAPVERPDDGAEGVRTPELPPAGPWSVLPRRGEPELPEPELPEPESTRPESTRPESTRPESTRPESTRPENTVPTGPEPAAGAVPPESSEDDAGHGREEDAVQEPAAQVERAASADDEGLSAVEPTEGLAAVPAALAGWVVVDPDDEDGSEPVALEHRPTGPLPVAAAMAAGPTMLTVHTDRDDLDEADDGYGPDFEPEPFGEAASAEPRSLSLVPPLPPSDAPEIEEVLGADPLSPDLRAATDLPEPGAVALHGPPSGSPTEPPAGPEVSPGIGAESSPRTGPDSSVPDEVTEPEALEATGSGPWAPEPVWLAEPESEPGREWEPVGRSVWAVDPAPGASAAGDGIPVFPLTDEPAPGDGIPVFPLTDEPAPELVPVSAGSVPARPVPEAPAPDGPPLTPAEAALPAEPVDDPSAAVVARQVEAARRHLQAALVVANGTAAPQLGSLLTAVEQVLTAVTDLARETRGVLATELAERTFPGESRFLCAGPWETAALVGREAYPDEAASPTGLAKLLRALGYDAQSVTSASGVAGVQVRSGRYAAHLALVEPAGGGRQRWSGALEWADGAGASRTWAETLGPMDLEEEELARRVDELLRRSIGPA